MGARRLTPYGLRVMGFHAVWDREDIKGKAREIKRRERQRAKAEVAEALVEIGQDREAEALVEIGQDREAEALRCCPACEEA